MTNKFNVVVMMIVISTGFKGRKGTMICPKGGCGGRGDDMF